MNTPSAMQSGRIQRRLGAFGIRAMLALPFVIALAGCASYAGRELVVGTSTMPAVIAEMGEPAMRWSGNAGAQQLAYPRGPEGPHTFMVYIDPDGRLSAIENVLVDRYFARIVPEGTQEEVLRLIGPPSSQWTASFGARNELVWEWRYCDSSGQMAKFDVLFDAETRRVRTTQSRPDYRGPDGGVPPCSQVPGR